MVGGRFAEAVVRQCDRMGYRGDVWPVHPERESIVGRACIRHIDDLPATPDAAFVGVNRIATIEVVRALSAMGAGGAVCYASGFSEVGDDGRELQSRLIEAAGPMPILGPNCYGLINYLDGALLWPDVHGGKRLDRGVALVTQSSNVGLNLTMSQRGVPLAYLLTVGNQAVVGLHDIVHALCDDERVSAIGMYIEGISDTTAFAESIGRARDGGIPVAVVKVGRTEASKRIALSHTASLAGSDRLMDAYFRRLGVARVHSIPALLETMKLLHAVGPLAGRDIVSLSCSGGEASIIADTASDKALNFRPFSEADRARIAGTVNPLVSVSNPFDYHTFDWGDRARLQGTFTAVMESGFDLTALVLDFPRAQLGTVPDWDVAWQAFASAAGTTGRAAAVISTLPECLGEEKSEQLAAAGLVPLQGVDEALSAMEAAAFIGESRPRPIIESGGAEACSLIALDELRAKRLLADYGIPIPRYVRCGTSSEAIAFWRDLHSPIVMKAVGDSLAHKTEVGGVLLDLNSEEQISAAYRQLSAIADGVFAEAMESDGVAELIVGAARDNVTGLHLIIGLGGVLAELARDTQILLLPVDRADIVHALDCLYFKRVLHGWRGRPPADIDAVVDVVLKIQDFVMAHLDTLEELDVNPLVVRRQNKGAVAVDALVRLRRAVGSDDGQTVETRALERHDRSQG